MSENKLKIDVNDLIIGMYVCELDIPWLDSPFLFQGFPLNCEDEIEEVKKICEYVYVDPVQTETSVRPNLIPLANSYRQRIAQAAGGDDKHKTVATRYDYREHLQLARKIYNNTRVYVSKTHKNVRDVKPIDITTAKSLVHNLAENILVNPNALMWLTHLKARHEYTLTHSINVCILALIFGRHLELHHTELELLGLGALLHDIGKLRIPPEILDKPGKFTDEEYEIMKTHPVEGYNILKDDMGMPRESLEVVLHHHERINGKGYPDALKNDQITRLIKLASIVDVYDAITSDRCYHDGMSPYKALQNIYSWTSDHFAKEYVEGFMSCMGIYPVGTIVMLNDGQTAIVIATTAKTKLRPMVMLVKDSKGVFYKQRKIYNLSSQKWNNSNDRLEISGVIEPKESDIKVSKILEQESLAPQQGTTENIEKLTGLLE